jgi:hypothetical protein
MARVRERVIVAIVWMVATLITHFVGLEITVAPLVMDGFDKEEIIKLAERTVKHRLGPPMVLDFISKIAWEVIEDPVEAPTVYVV